MGSGTTTLVIVFGAAGRLGRRLLPLLPSASTTVLGVVRRETPQDWPAGPRSMRLDVSDAADRTRGIRELAEIAAGHESVVLVDLVLRRTTVHALRGSIASAGRCLLGLHDRLVADGRSSALVTATTTSALEPWPFRTPYGIAKRRQLAGYASADVVGEAFLLPSLRDDEAQVIACFGLAWTYEEAAHHLAEAVSRVAAGTTGFHLVAPTPRTRYTEAERHTSPNFGEAAIGLVPVHLRLILGGRDSLAAHRDATHHRLALTGPLRRRLDHHFAPAGLVRRLSRSFGVPVRLVRSREHTWRAR